MAGQLDRVDRRPLYVRYLASELQAGRSSIREAITAQIYEIRTRLSSN